jgi:small subunit ribosomal protein S8
MQFYHAFSNLKNSAQSGKPAAIIRTSKYIVKVLDILYLNGFIEGYKFLDDFHIQVFITYMPNGLPLVNSLQLVSKPSRRCFVTYKQLMYRFFGKFIIISTSQGLMTGHDAIRRKLGGELIFVKSKF